MTTWGSQKENRFGQWIQHHPKVTAAAICPVLALLLTAGVASVWAVFGGSP